MTDATDTQIAKAFAAAKSAQHSWDARGGAARAVILRAMADALESDRDVLMAIIVNEAGKTWPDAIGEVREASDFCRYYALLAERYFSRPEQLKGPVGETNALELRGRGVFACISPWNFPLAIFTGQVAAALAAGNTVVAKPAEQTPRVAAAAVKLFKEAGLPDEVLHLVPGPGETVGAALIGHPDLAGVAFTGGTDTARVINRGLAARDGALLPFIAETGGLNAMFVDTTAQREQVIDDVILSAFGSAGQRCSALRLLFVPEETADDLIESLKGAMDVLTVGDPHLFTTDIGPVIDSDAKAALERRRAHLQKSATILKEITPTGSNPLLFGPLMAEIPLSGVARPRSVRPDPACHPLSGGRTGIRSPRAGRQGLWPDARHPLAIGKLCPARPRAGSGRQHLCQPHHHRRRGRRAALRWGRAVGHRPQGGRALFADTPCGGARGQREYRRPGRRSGVT